MYLNEGFVLDVFMTSAASKRNTHTLPGVSTESRPSNGAMYTPRAHDGRVAPQNEFLQQRIYASWYCPECCHWVSFHSCKPLLVLLTSGE